MKPDRISNLEDELLERFVRYAQIETTSNAQLAQEKTPSTPGQLDLLRLIKEELEEYGMQDVELDDNGYLTARLYAGGNSSTKKTIGFMAHVDTSSDAPGAGVKPVIHRNYDGKRIVLDGGVVLDPESEPLLGRYAGSTVITSDGSTLLGADDKAGVAEIVTAAKWLAAHPDFQSVDLELIFTPDEETGMGLSRFPVDRLKSEYCFTVDGGTEGEIERECYYAREARVSFKGNVIHPGAARGRLVNAVSMASFFVSLLPRNESPEATDGRYGNYWAHSISGEMGEAEVVVFFRSFDMDDIQRRSEALESFASAVRAAFPGGSVTISEKEQYRNMREKIDFYPDLMEKLNAAVRDSGVEPVEKPIRGGTDGSRLTEMGIPTPNIFTGGVNFHSRSEWAALPAMMRAVAVLVNLAGAWS